MVKVIYYSLSSPFCAVKTESFDSDNAGILAVEQYAKENGFTNVKQVEDEDFEVRMTATTPNGRAGRNIARLEFGWE